MFIKLAIGNQGVVWTRRKVAKFDFNLQKNILVVLLFFGAIGKSRHLLTISGCGRAPSLASFIGIFAQPGSKLSGHSLGGFRGSYGLLPLNEDVVTSLMNLLLYHGLALAVHLILF